MSGYVATTETMINASAGAVWSALTDPEQIKLYMMGSQVDTDWQPGSPITWKGEFEGKAYEDKGAVLEVTPERALKVTHFSPLSGQDDSPENYHTVSYVLDEIGDRTKVTLTQDNNNSAQDAAHSQETWSMMLEGLKKVAEDHP